MTANIADRGDDASSDRVIAYLLDFALLSIGAFALWIVSVAITMATSFGTTMGMSAMDASGPPTGSILATMAVSIAINGVLWLLIGAMLVWYFIYYAEDGQTFGKRSQDVAVVDANGGAPSKRQRLIRTAVLLAPFPLMALFGALLGGVGFVVALFLMAVWLGVEALVLFVSDGGQRLGDHAAGTYVVDASD